MECPYCGNVIKEGAIRCKFCKRDLPLSDNKYQEVQKGKDETKLIHNGKGSLASSKKVSTKVMLRFIASLIIFLAAALMYMKNEKTTYDIYREIPVPDWDWTGPHHQGDVVDVVITSDDYPMDLGDTIELNVDLLKRIKNTQIMYVSHIKNLGFAAGEQIPVKVKIREIRCNGGNLNDCSYHAEWIEFKKEYADWKDKHLKNVVKGKAAPLNPIEAKAKFNAKVDEIYISNPPIGKFADPGYFVWHGNVSNVLDKIVVCWNFGSGFGFKLPPVMTFGETLTKGASIIVVGHLTEVRSVTMVIGQSMMPILSDCYVFVRKNSY